MRGGGLIAGGIIMVVLAVIVWAMFYTTVDQGERCVLVTQGKVSGELDAGFHSIGPFSDAKCFSVQAQLWRWEGLPTYSADQQVTDLTVSMNMSIDPSRIVDIYTTYGTIDNMVDRLVDPRVKKVVKENFSSYTAASAIANREALGVKMEDSVRKALADLPIRVEGFQLENIDFSETYELAVEERMQAEVEVAKLEQQAKQAEVTARMTVTKAQAEADSNLARAEAEAEAIKLKGEAEAASIRAKAEALGSNPNLVTLTAAEKWNGVLPTQMVPEGSVPFLPLGNRN